MEGPDVEEYFDSIHSELRVVNLVRVTRLPPGRYAAAGAAFVVNSINISMIRTLGNVTAFYKNVGWTLNPFASGR